MTDQSPVSTANAAAVAAVTTPVAPASNKKDAPIAAALREAGFIPLPRLWVKREDMAEIHAIAERYRKEVNTLRGTIRETHPELDDRYQPKCNDPKLDKNAAWAQFEKLQSARRVG